MSHRRLRNAAALAVTAVAGAAHTQTSGPAPHIWAARALYGFEVTACSPAGTPGDITAVIAPALCSQLTADRRSAISTTFVDAVNRHFPNVEQVFGSHLPDDASPRARLRGTLVASLRLTRATYATVPKAVGVDVFMPITLTLDITNIASGEVVFTRSRTYVAEGTYAADRVEAELTRQLPGQISASIESLVAEAATAFRPYLQSATVVGQTSLGREGRAWVLDKGRSGGLRTGDAIGEDGQIVHAGPDYAIVQPVLGTYNVGQRLARTAVAPVETLARPGVLTIVEAAPAGYAFPFVGQIFEDALGNLGSLAPVPVNPAFGPLRTLALSEARASLDNDARNLPDYIASLRVVLLDPATFPSNLPNVEIDHYEAHAFVTMVDATGRVVGAWQGTSRIDDRISAGVRFSATQRRDAVLRNALVDAAGKMANFRPQPHPYLVRSAGGSLMIADPENAIPLGMTLRVLRPAGRFAGVAGPVLVPAGEVNIVNPVPGGVSATNVGLTAYLPREGDLVVLENAGAPTMTRRAVAQCVGIDGQPAFDIRGATPMALWQQAAENLLAQRISAPLRLATLPARLRSYGASFVGWKGFDAAQPRPVDTCFLPQIAIQPVGSGYSVAVGFGLRRGDEKVGSSGLQVTMTPTLLPLGTSELATAAMLQADLANEVPKVALQAAGQLRPAP